MALRFGTSTTQIRGYCQQVSSTTDGFTFRRGAKLFIAGAVTALAVCHLWIGTKLDAAREEERARRLRWEDRN